MRSLRTIAPLSLVLAVVVLMPLQAHAICSFFCTSAAISIDTVNNHGIQHGSATINLKNAVSSPFLPDLNYIEDEDNGQDFRVDSPFFGVPTIVPIGGVLKFEGDSYRLGGIVLNFYDSSGDFILPAFIPSNATVSYPAIALPCITFYSISSPLTSAQVGQIVVSGEPDDPSELLFAMLSGELYDALCGGSSKRATDVAFIDLRTADDSGETNIDVGETVKWYNGSGGTMNFNFSDGRSMSVGANAWSIPMVFEDEGTTTYQVAGLSDVGMVNVGSIVAVPDNSWGSLKANFDDK